MSTMLSSRYVDYESTCPRCQQIIQTIDLTYQQGIFIYDLTYIQQELESVLIAAKQRQKQLIEHNGDELQLPNTSTICLLNGSKKQRDFKAERERRRKAFNGHPTKKRRMKKNVVKQVHSTITKFQINQIYTPDQFWLKLVDFQQDLNRSIDCLQKLIRIDENLLENIDDELAKEFVRTKDYILLTDNDYQHPELNSSIVIQRNQRFIRLIDRLSNNHRLKRKYSTMIDTDERPTDVFQQNSPIFTSKSAELDYRLRESLQLERLALRRAEKQHRFNEISIQMSDIDEKILEITNSIRQRKRPSENLLSQCKSLSPISASNQSTNDDQSWRKGRRQSTLRIYDELERLINQRIQFDKQLDERNLSFDIHY